MALPAWAALRAHDVGQAPLAAQGLHAGGVIAAVEVQGLDIGEQTALGGGVEGRFEQHHVVAVGAGDGPTQYARIARRRGPNKAAVAVANSMLFTIWHLLTTGALYNDPDADYYERRHDPAVEAERLARRIEALGFDVSLTEKAA